MYAIDWVAVLGSRAEAVRSRRRTVSATVWALGFTSFFTDVSSEMVASVLPAYLVLQLGFTPLAFGVVDGLYQSAAALMRIAAGVASDRWRRHKEIAVAGYGVSAISRLVLLAAGSAPLAIGGAVAIDRFGKGIRTAPRDALIAASSPHESLGTAFGAHRSLDAAGAMLGPVIAFALLAAMPGAFDLIFVASFAIAVVGVGVIVLFVDRGGGRQSTAAPPVHWAEVLAVLRAPRFRALAAVAFILALPTISDGFLFLMLQRRLDLGMGAFPLLFTMTALWTSVLALPFGRVADRVGRLPTLLGGYLALGTVYGLVAWGGSGFPVAFLALGLLGAYYAATDGVIAASAAALLPSSQTAAGLAAVATAINLARLCASVGFGVLWTRWDGETATVAFLAALSVGLVAAAVIARQAALWDGGERGAHA